MSDNGYAQPPYLPQAIDAATAVFPANVRRLMPDPKVIPEEFNQHYGKWQQVQADWFFCGLKNAQWKPRSGIDSKTAVRHLAAIQGSFEPKHEHKAAAVAYLMSLWFEDVTYEKAKPIR